MGSSLGISVGAGVGNDGTIVGEPGVNGAAVGVGVGSNVGLGVCIDVGAIVGLLVGCGVGFVVGEGMG